jgi:hypothetical protein
MIYGTASAKTIFIIIGKIMICAKQRLILLLFYSYIREMTKTTAERAVGREKNCRSLLARNTST